MLRGVRRLLHDEGYTIKGVQRLHREEGVRRADRRRRWHGRGWRRRAMDEDADFALPPRRRRSATTARPC